VCSSDLPIERDIHPTPHIDYSTTFSNPSGRASLSSLTWSGLSAMVEETQAKIALSLTEAMVRRVVREELERAATPSLTPTGGELRAEYRRLTGQEMPR
jgi:hypothetical protein